MIPWTAAYQASLSPRIYSNSCQLSRWHHPAISSFVAPRFSSYPQSFPESEYFPISLLFILDGQSMGTSASVLPMNIQGWFPLGLIGLLSLLSKGSQESSAPQFEVSILWHLAFFRVQAHIHTLLLEHSVIFSVSLCQTDNYKLIRFPLARKLKMSHFWNIDLLCLPPPTRKVVLQISAHTC